MLFTHKHNHVIVIFSSSQIKRRESDIYDNKRIHFAIWMRANKKVPLKKPHMVCIMPLHVIITSYIRINTSQPKPYGLWHASMILYHLSHRLFPSMHSDASIKFSFLYFMNDCGKIIITKPVVCMKFLNLNQLEIKHHKITLWHVDNDGNGEITANNDFFYEKCKQPRVFPTVRLQARFYNHSKRNNSIKSL